MNEKQINQFLRRKFSTLGWSLIFYDVLLVGLVVITMQVDSLMQILRAMADRSFVPDVNAINNNAWGYIAAILAGMVILHGWKGSDYWRQEILAKEKSMTAGAFFAILVLTIGAQMASSIWFNLVELVMNLNGSSIMPMLEEITGASESFSMLLYSAVFAPIGEEILFRGYVLRSLRPYGKRFSILLSALLFAMFHGNFLQLPYAFVMGLVMGYVAVEYSFVWALVVHVFNNLILAEAFSLMYAVLPEGVYYFLDMAFFGGCALASVILLLVNRHKIRDYRHSEWMDRRCLKCFFTSPSILILLAILAMDMVRMFL